MPKAAPRPCTQLGCCALVRDGSGRCADHQREQWVKRTPVKRITGRRLQAMRARLFSRQPLCVLCLEQGIATAATQRDHEIPLEEGGLDDETNEQALCLACHDIKSKAERARAGRTR
jgi:5-methylcytosine-specific restriction protein A